MVGSTARTPGACVNVLGQSGSFLICPDLAPFRRPRAAFHLSRAIEQEGRRRESDRERHCDLGPGFEKSLHEQSPCAFITEASGI